MLRLQCDECNAILFNDERVYCYECWDKDQKLISELQDRIKELEDRKESK